MNSDNSVADIAMGILEVHAWLVAHGFPYTERQVVRMASARKLPFKPGPDGRKLFIWRSQLERAVLPH